MGPKAFTKQGLVNIFYIICPDLTFIPAGYIFPGDYRPEICEKDHHHPGL
jgi:hypothetical protein